MVCRGAHVTRELEHVLSLLLSKYVGSFRTQLLINVFFNFSSHGQIERACAQEETHGLSVYASAWKGLCVVCIGEQGVATQRKFCLVLRTSTCILVRVVSTTVDKSPR